MQSRQRSPHVAHLYFAVGSPSRSEPLTSLQFLQMKSHLAIAVVFPYECVCAALAPGRAVVSEVQRGLAALVELFRLRFSRRRFFGFHLRDYFANKLA